MQLHPRLQYATHAQGSRNDQSLQVPSQVGDGGYWQFKIQLAKALTLCYSLGTKWEFSQSSVGDY